MDSLSLLFWAERCKDEDASVLAAREMAVLPRRRVFFPSTKDLLTCSRSCMEALEGPWAAQQNRSQSSLELLECPIYRRHLSRC